jgi:nitrite reductase/ring-hydroxylating ferredoxin subunit
LFTKAEAGEVTAVTRQLAANEFFLADLPPGRSKLLTINGMGVAVYNVDGAFYATEDACTHEGGPLSEGALDGAMVICPWHDSCFDVKNGAVLKGPAVEPLQTYTVTIDGDVGRVE